MKTTTASCVARASRILRGFALVYTMLGFVSIFYLPAALAERRVLLVTRLGLFAVSVGLAGVFAFLAFRRGELTRDDRKDGRRLFRNKSAGILLIWFLWAAAACLLAVREGMSTLLFNGGFLLDQLVNFLVLFPLGLALARRRDDRLLRLLAWCVYLLFLPYLISGLAVAFTGGSFSFLGRVVCLEDGRLRLGGNPNTAGVYAALSFTLGFYLFMSTSRRGLRWLLGTGEALLLVLMVFTGSRSALLATAAGIVFYAFVILVRRRRERRGGEVSFSRAWLPALIVGAALLLALVLLILFGRRIPVVNGLMERYFSDLSLSRRGLIWEFMLRGLSRRPHVMLHGCSSAQVPYLVRQIYGALRNTHNQLLEVCLGQGIPALVLFLLFLGLLLRDSLTTAFCARAGEPVRITPLADGPMAILRGDAHGAVWTIPLLLLVLFVHSMAEVTLVNMGTTLGSLFFLSAGYVTGTGELLREGKRSGPA